MAKHARSGPRGIRLQQAGWLRAGLVAVVIAMISSIVGLNASIVSATQISGAIKNVVISSPETALSSLKLSEDWCLPDGTKAGDTFSQTLPSQLGGWPAAFNLPDAAGDVVATATISTATPPVVTYTMTSYAETHQDVCGTAQFSGYLINDGLDGTTQQLVVTDDDGTQFTSTVTIPPAVVIDRSTGRKTGAFADFNDQCRTNQTDCIIWGVESPVGPVDSGTMTDTAIAGQVFDCSKVAMYLGDDSGPNQAFAHGVATTTGITISCTTTSISATFSSLATGKVLQLSIPTSLTAGDNNGGIDFQNTATITSTYLGKTISTPSTAYIDSTRATGTGEGDQTPKISIDKWSTADGETAGAFDTAPGKAIPANTATPITMTITNTGTEPLVNVHVTDATTSGPVLTGLACDFSPLGGPSTGVTWNGPFAVGASFKCTGTVPAMTVGGQETDTATVTANGQTDNTPVTATNPWNGSTPASKPSITIVKGDANGNAADTSDTAPNLGSEPASVGLVYTVTNNGNEALANITITDQLVSNGTVTALSCNFSALGGPATGTTWAGPLAVGASFPCTAQLSGVVSGTGHEDIGTVTGTGVVSGTKVTATNPYYATATPVVTPVELSGLAFTGTNTLTPLWLGGGLLVVGFGLILLGTRVGRSQQRT